jgi:hypothetical protein
MAADRKITDLQHVCQVAYQDRPTRGCDAIGAPKDELERLSLRTENGRLSRMLGKLSDRMLIEIAPSKRVADDAKKLEMLSLSTTPVTKRNGFDGADLIGQRSLKGDHAFRRLEGVESIDESGTTALPHVCRNRFAISVHRKRA